MFILQSPHSHSSSYCYVLTDLCAWNVLCCGAWCVRLRVLGWAPICKYVEAKPGPQCPPPPLPSSLRQGSLFPWTRLTIPGRLANLSLLAQCWGYRHTQSYPIFSVGAGNSNSGPRDCRASTLTHRAIFPAPWSSFFLIVMEL